MSRSAESSPFPLSSAFSLYITLHSLSVNGDAEAVNDLMGRLVNQLASIPNVSYYSVMFHFIESVLISGFITLNSKSSLLLALERLSVGSSHLF